LITNGRVDPGGQFWRGPLARQIGKASPDLFGRRQARLAVGQAVTCASTVRRSVAGNICST